MTVNPVAVIRYQYDNHLGSASLELDENANIISYEEYHPFGTTSYRSGRTETETSQKRYKYVGKERDEETGLYYYGFRYYAAWLCRFVSVDPLQFEYPQLTPYQYAGNKPITYMDIEGLQAEGDEKLGLTTVECNPEPSEAGALKYIGTLYISEKATETTMNVVYKSTAEAGARSGFSWGKLFKGGLISLACAITFELFSSTNDSYTFEELEEQHFGDHVPEDFRNSAKNVELFLNEARRQGVIPYVNTDFAEEFDWDDDSDEYEYFYRAVGQRELMITGGTLQHRLDEKGEFRDEGPWIATNPACVMNRRSFVYNKNHIRKYDYIIRYKVPKGTREYLEENALDANKPGENDLIMKRAIATGKLIRKIEKKGTPIESVNYNFPGMAGNIHFNKKIKGIFIVPIIK